MGEWTSLASKILRNSERKRPGCKGPTREKFHGVRVQNAAAFYYASTLAIVRTRPPRSSHIVTSTELCGAWDSASVEFDTRLYARKTKRNAASSSSEPVATAIRNVIVIDPPRDT